MDINKSQRLSQYMGVVSDMVNYADIRDSMVHSGLISLAEANDLERRLQVEGDDSVMSELMTMVSLRRGGFDAFVNALRVSDYNWLAEQLDPGKSLTGMSSGPGSTGRANAMQNIMANVRQRISRKSDAIQPAAQDDMIFTSYRDSCPLDIPINPSFYGSTPRLTFPNSEAPSSSSSHACYTGDTETETLQLDKFKKLTLQSPPNLTDVVIHNVIPTLIKTEECEYFQYLGKRANIPSPLLKDLKVISKGKVCKVKKPSRNLSKVKLRLNSEAARDRFVQDLKEYIANLKPSDITYPTVKQMKVSIPKRGRFGKLKGKREKVNREICSQKLSDEITTDVEQGCKDSSSVASRTWFHKRLRFRSKKKL